MLDPSDPPDPLSHFPHPAPAWEDNVVNGSLSSWFSVGFGQWWLLEEIRVWEKMGPVVFNPLAPSLWGPSMEGYSFCQDPFHPATLLLWVLATATSSCPFRLWGSDRSPLTFPGYCSTPVHPAHVFIKSPFIKLSSNCPCISWPYTFSQDHKQTHFCCLKKCLN